VANAVYPLGLQKILDAEIDFSADTSDTFKIMLLDSDAAYSALDEFLDDVNSDAVATSSALTSVSTTSPGGGAVDAANVTFSALTGSECTAWVLFKDTTVASTSPLLLWVDTEADTSAFSYTPNGSDFTLQFGSGGIFSLAGS